jgi:nicotinate-nucleotide pyrophosphorylase (carboxylating)
MYRLEKFEIKHLAHADIASIVKRALKEDIASGDITTDSLIPENQISEGYFLVKENACLCGTDVVQEVFKEINKKIRFRVIHKDGEKVKAGTRVLEIKGPTRSILTGERVALNFFGILSGIATNTCTYVNAVKPYKTKILDTRKTIPGLRLLSKYAVECGGGMNHRLDLSMMAMIKDNHREVCRMSITEAVNTIRKKHKKLVEVEADDQAHLQEALTAGADIILLDNMSLRDIKKAVKTVHALPRAKRPLLEVSGGVTLKDIKKIAATGVDTISIGRLTHTVNNVDISLELLPHK